MSHILLYLLIGALPETVADARKHVELDHEDESEVDDSLDAQKYQHSSDPTVLDGEKVRLVIQAVGSAVVCKSKPHNLFSAATQSNRLEHFYLNSKK